MKGEVAGRVGGRRGSGGDCEGDGVGVVGQEEDDKEEMKRIQKQ